MNTKADGAGHKRGSYRISDREMAAGSTLGSPKAALVIKATGAVERFYSVDLGETVIGTIVLHHWDSSSGVPLVGQPGEFIVEPCRQDHVFRLSNGVEVHETIFVSSGAPSGNTADPPAAYYRLTLTNASRHVQEMETYASADLRGDTAHDVHASYDDRQRAFVASNKSNPYSTRLFSCSATPTSWEVTTDAAKSSAPHFTGRLRNDVQRDAAEPTAIFHFHHRLSPDQVVQLHFTLTLSTSAKGRAAALRALADCPPADEALQRTENYYEKILSRAVVTTPDPEVNRGVLWAKANMVRTQLLAATGWCSVNDPTRSNNSVGEETLAGQPLAPTTSRLTLHENHCCGMRITSKRMEWSSSTTISATVKLKTTG